MVALAFDREAALAAADSFAVCAGSFEDVEISEGAFDYVITDPPYLPRTQDNVRRGRQNRSGISEPKLLGFSPLTAMRRQRWAEQIAISTRRGALVFSDHEGSVAWAEDLERAGLTYYRTCVWVRHGGAPQFTGDRPAQGHECIVFAYKGTPRWNGRGKKGVYEERIVRGDIRMHETQKPLSLLIDLARDFVDPGERVFDPFAGAGTTLVGCKLIGASCAGLDINPKFAAYAARRAAAASPHDAAAQETT